MRNHRIRRSRGPASRCCSRASSASSTAATTRPGIALLEDDGLDYVRAVGNLQPEGARAGRTARIATTGLGHTRWATHGGVTEENAHPLTGCDDAQARDRPQRDRRELPRADASARRRGPHVHLRDRRRGRRAPASSAHYDGDLVEAVRAAFAELEGHFAFVVIHHDHPDLLVGVRHQTAARRRRRRRRDVPRLERRGVPRARRAACSSPTTARSSRSRPRARSSTRRTARRRARDVELDWDDEGAEKAGYETFMLKEIYEQPEAVARDDRRPRPPRHARPRGPRHDRAGAPATCAASSIVACGTAYHAGVVGRYVIEEWARVPVEPDIASEWIYRNPVIDRGHARDRHLPVRRDARHDRGDEARPRARRAHRRDHEHDGLADHARGRLRALHARRPRGRRRRLEDVHRAGRAALPDRAQARADPRARCRQARSSSSSTSVYELPDEDPARSWTATTRSRRSRSATTTRRSSSTSAATSGCRSRSRARSS